jgi:circadian clock protein KaiC
MSNAERVQTGIPGLDEMIGGGIPRGRVVLVVGGPGTGKTILCAQFIYAGIVTFGETGAFIRPSNIKINGTSKNISTKKES